MKVLKSFKLRGDVNFDFDILAWLKPQFSLGVNFYELPIALIEFCNIYLSFLVISHSDCETFVPSEKNFTFCRILVELYQQGINSRFHTEIQLQWVFIGSVYFRDWSCDVFVTWHGACFRVPLLPELDWNWNWNCKRQNDAGPAEDITTTKTWEPTPTTT